MKKTKKGWINSTKILQILCVFVVTFAFPLSSMAQTTWGDVTDPDTPIDGGISLLVIAGVGYGAKKLYNMRNKKK